jgi:hypothetical protein
MGGVAKVVGKVLKSPIGKVAGTVLGGPAGGMIAGAAGSIIGGLGGKGGKSTTTTGQGTEQYTQMEPASAAEMAANRTVDRGLGSLDRNSAASMQAAQSDDVQISSLFRNMLVDTMKSNGFASPEQIAKASEYVDATFTAPARQQFQRGMEEFQGAQDARAAALGREVNDTGFNVDTASQFQRGLGDIEMQRGAMVQQRADELAFERPMAQAQLGMQGSAFFNDRAQRAFQNRAGVLDMASQRQNQMFNQRLAGGRQVGSINQTQSSQDKMSIGERVTGIGQGILGAANAAKTIRKAF